MAAGKRPAVFLDRDGVINERHLLPVRRVHQFRFIDGVLDAFRRLAKSPYAVVVATNQPFVGARVMSQRALDRVHATMVEQVRDAGGRVDAVYACTAPPWADAACRKPRPGMLFEAAAALDLDLTTSWMVGDKWRDVQMGHTAGCRTILVNAHPATRAMGDNVKPHVRAANLAEAVDHILAAPTLTR